MGVLEVLELHGNILDGDFYTRFLLLTTSIHLNLSGNLLTSSSGFNQFDGTFPNGLISMPTLQELHLQSNKLSGSADLFPSSFVSNVSNIRALDISDNQLDGDFPNEFSQQVLDSS
ncbi:LRR receptor-like serine/threonine-protein kinase [Artemisia annua]|uniref:LRR receptor-like serine/threonine-protein kinase n=1 Tax=Artemisia annua TaxID=35608 RepID=A0A2U1QJR4_ARTAN|nr:LRR receptor-like serine/threonine-protein kinase [Artemisia annua]